MLTRMRRGLPRSKDLLSSGVQLEIYRRYIEGNVLLTDWAPCHRLPVYEVGVSKNL